MSTNKQALREAADAANKSSWGRWESYHPHKGARGYEVKVGVKAIAQHCLKVDSAFIAAANPATVLALLDELEAAERRIAELEAIAVAEYANKRGFSFQHGSIHAHFGNGDVMVGSVTFENGDAGINFAPVREKIGGVGTDYEWTRGKTAEQVDSVFVIASSNIAGLEVIRNKLSDAIETLRAAATDKGE